MLAITKAGVFCSHPGCRNSRKPALRAEFPTTPAISWSERWLQPELQVPMCCNLQHEALGPFYPSSARVTIHHVVQLWLPLKHFLGFC